VLPQGSEMPGECLLCIRNNLHTVLRVRSAVPCWMRVCLLGAQVAKSMPNPRRLVGRPSVLNPPFQNIVGPGGYRPECCLLAKDAPEVLPCDVVGSHLMPLALSYNAVEGMWFLDQRELVFTGGQPMSN
jgi:hypothetical protein